MNKKTTDILDIIQKLYKEGKYDLALENYLWCFNHAEKQDSIWKSAKLGACLLEWYELGLVYSPAMDALVMKKNELKDNLLKLKEVERFIEYVKICSVLKLDNESIKLFKYYHQNNKEIAKQVYSDISQILIKALEWNLCSLYLDDTEKEYEKILNLFDGLMKTSKEMYRGEYNQVYQDKFIIDIENLFIILEKDNRLKEIEKIQNRLEEDLKSRGGSVR